MSARIDRQLCFLSNEDDTINLWANKTKYSSFAMERRILKQFKVNMPAEINQQKIGHSRRNGSIVCSNSCNKFH